MTSVELHLLGKTNEGCTSNSLLEDEEFQRRHIDAFMAAVNNCLTVMSLQEADDAVIKDTPDNVQVLDKATAPDEEFSDDRLLDEDKTIFFRTVSRADHKKILTRFYRLYFTGTILTGDTLFAILADVISMSYGENTRLWDEKKDFGNECWYSPNQSAEDELKLSALSPSVQFIESDSSLSANVIQQDKSCLATYAVDANTKFYEYVKVTIDEIKPTEAVTQKECELWNLSGFLALTFLRFTTKNITQMSRAFLKSRYRINLGTVGGWPAGRPFSLPSQSCLTVCASGLSRNLAPMPKMFTKLVSKLILIDRNPLPSYGLRAYIVASVLNHTAQNGLGLITMIAKVGKITGLTLSELIEQTFSDSTAESWKLVSSSYQSQKGIDHVPYGYNWARVIDLRYFRGLSPKKQPFLATILTSVIAQVQGEGVWEAEWAKTEAVGMEDAKAIGVALFSDTRPTLENLRGSVEAMKIVKMALEMQNKDYDCDIAAATNSSF